MSYSAVVAEVMIASPSDVNDVRKIAREVIEEWNLMHTRTLRAVLIATGWETHSAPDLSGRPQQLINDRLLSNCDLLVGIFWTRIGTPTGKAISGTIEEITAHRKAGRPVMLYFSQAPIRPDKLNSEQYKLLLQFKAWAQKEGLVEHFNRKTEFRDRFRKQLQFNLQDNSYLKSLFNREMTATRDL